LSAGAPSRSPSGGPRLRVALVRALYSDFGGAEQAAMRTLQALAERDVEVTLITRRWREDRGVRILACDPFYLGSLWRDWGFARAACGALEGHRFDLVQSHERMPCCDVYRAGDGVHLEWLRQRRRSMGGLGRLRLALNPYHRYVAAMERRLYSSARLKAVICNSAMVKAEIRAWFGVPEPKLHVIYSGVDTARFHPGLRERRALERRRHGIPEDARLFLFVGSGFERKGVRQLVEALDGLPAEAHLLIVGKDKDARRYEALAGALGVASRVRFAGPLADVTGAYAAADAFALPTLYDPFPNAALEAMACGLPVLTSTKSGAAEFVEAGVNGYVCDALDVPRLREHMARLMPREACEAMGRESRARVEPYSLERMSARYVELYASLLGRA
jgi:UDP-glucose:(heptosyl)LPS alpha-1,3-glucosyltransferase